MGSSHQYPWHRSLTLNPAASWRITLFCPISSRVNLTSSSISWIVPIKFTRKGQVIEISPEKSLAITSLLSMPERLTFIEVAPICNVVTGTPISCFPCWYDPCRGKHTCALLTMTKENPSFASAWARMLMLPFAKPSQSSSRTMPVSSANTTLIAQWHYCNLHPWLGVYKPIIL